MMSDEKKAAILAELVALTQETIKIDIPDGAMTIEELVSGLRAEIPGLGHDRSVEMVKKMVKVGKLQVMRVGSRKYYYQT